MGLPRPAPSHTSWLVDFGGSSLQAVRHIGNAANPPAYRLAEWDCSKHELTIDRAEAEVLEAILSACTPDDEFMNRTVKPGAATLDEWDADGNGQITCRELRQKGVATPIDTSHPAWPFVKDAGCDGSTCMN